MLYIHFCSLSFFFYPELVHFFLYNNEITVYRSSLLYVYVLFFSLFCFMCLGCRACLIKAVIVCAYVSVSEGIDMILYFVLFWCSFGVISFFPEKKKRKCSLFHY